MLKDFIINLKRVITNRISFNDNISSWAQAKSSSTGYEAQEILIKVRKAYIDAQKKSNVYERDSALIKDGAVNWPLVAMIYWSSAQISKEIRVLDFGGSFASQYFQNESFLNYVNVKWSVVEQKHFVLAAKEIIKNKNINFYDEISECLRVEKPNFALFGSSLQYLENPFEIMDNLLTQDLEVLIIDRMPIHQGSEDIVIVQKVDKSIYDASYPAWIFSEEKLTQFMSNDWTLMNVFDCIGGRQKTRKGINFDWKGYIYIKKSSIRTGDDTEMIIK